MKRLWLVIMTASVLVAVVTGCGGAGRYDARLVAADSLMQPDPDSALALVQAVPRGSLTREGDRAYRDLLLTQARYKAYITASSDSDINRALDYYRRHSGEREKLTRAYIYNGSVMDELNHPDSAMLYYKHAEATAAPTDYFNLGYTKMRMGSLYSDYYAFDGVGINKYESALECFQQAKELTYQHKCLNNLGCLYRENNSQKAEQLLNNALSIAQQYNDTIGIINDSHALIVLHYYDKNYNHALQLIHYIKKLGCPTDFSLYTTIANVYSRVGLPDSAAIYLNLALNEGIDDDEKRLYYLESLSELELSRGNITESLRLNHLYNHISDSLMSNTEKLSISKTENDYDFHTNNSIKTKSQKSNRLIIIFFITIIILAVLISLYLRRIQVYRRIVGELKKESNTHLNTLNLLQHNINKLKIDDRQIKSFVNKQLELLREISVACYQEPQNKLGKRVKHILQFNDQNQEEWIGLYHYIDAEYNGIMSKTRENYPQLNDKDLLLLALSCLGFSYIQIAMILGYSNHTSVSTLKKRLAEKMMLDGSLNDYITAMSHS